MSPGRRRLLARDQYPTRLSGILARLCEATGALGAALVDHEGETVDYAGYRPPYELKVLAAEWRLILELLARVDGKLGWPGTRELVVRAAQASFIAVPLSEGYALVVEHARYATELSSRALGEAVRELCGEAALELPRAERLERWQMVEVRTSAGDQRRPEALWRDGRWSKLEILGRYVEPGLGRREVGYRVRLDIGVDISLVRERLGRWYAHDLPDP